MHASSKAVSPLVVPSTHVLLFGDGFPNNYVHEGASRVNQEPPDLWRQEVTGEEATDSVIQSTVAVNGGC